MVVTHGGAGVPSIHSDGCVAACRAGHEALRRGASALHAAVAAVRVLEDDVRYNAGLGAAVRLDGATIQLDASVADVQGFGAVVGVQGLRHPVDLALAVRNSPHVMLAGQGAQAFARKLGFTEEDLATPQKRDAVHRVWATLQGDPRWKGHDPRALWNFDSPPPAALPAPASDTVGAVVRDAHGDVAAAVSTGGTSYALLGRVGDAPIFGAGLYVSRAGAVVATGMGEEIWRRLSSRDVHDAMVRGTLPAEAARAHCAAFPHAFDVGILCVSADGWGAASNRDMAWAAMVGDTVAGMGAPP